MQSLIKTCALPIVLLSLTACGGGGGGSKPVTSSAASSAPIASSVAPSSIPASSAAASSAATAAESTQTPVDYTSYSVAVIDNCGQGITAGDKTFSLFADYDGGIQNQSLSSLKITGWNHTTNGVTAEWTNLKLAGSNYNFNANAKVNSSCNDVDTLDMVLVKKIADWDHQHANGFERSVIDYGHEFGDIESLVFDVKINSAKTSIPSVESVKTTYASYVTAATVDTLEDGKVNIGITLGDNTNLNGAIIFQLDQAALSDKWVRVTIPMSKLSFYQEINYNRTAKTLADFSNVVIKRMLVVAETKSGAVLRGNINPWTTSVPETFKEADLSFKKIEFKLK